MEESRKSARKPRAAAAPKPAAKKTAAAGKTVARKSAAAKVPAPAATPSAAEREHQVRLAAYFRAERRGFEPGLEWDDWLAAEAEVNTAADARPASGRRKAPARKSKPR